MSGKFFDDWTADPAPDELKAMGKAGRRELVASAIEETLGEVETFEGLARRTGVPRPTVVRLVRELVEAGQFSRRRTRAGNVFSQPGEMDQPAEMDQRDGSARARDGSIHLDEMDQSARDGSHVAHTSYVRSHDVKRSSSMTHDRHAIHLEGRDATEENPSPEDEVSADEVRREARRVAIERAATLNATSHAASQLAEDAMLDALRVLAQDPTETERTWEALGVNGRTVTELWRRGFVTTSSGVARVTEDGYSALSERWSSP